MKIGLLFCVSFLFCSCGNECEYITPDYGVCVVSDDGGYKTTALEIDHMIAVLEEVRSGSSIKAADFQVEIVAEAFLVDGQYRRGVENLGEDYAKITRESNRSCFAHTAFTHEYVHSLLDYYGVKQKDGKHDEYFWFEFGWGVVDSANKLYWEKYCNPLNN